MPTTCRPRASGPGRAAALTGTAIVALRGVGRRYGAVQALEGIDLQIAPGEAVSICGDNGAGKSTLIRILSGADQPSEGSIAIDGAPVRLASPAEAMARGIATIYQDLALAPRLSIAQNVFMGGERLRRPAMLGLLDKRRMRREARDYLARFDFAVSDMDRPVAALSGGQRQAVALARALRLQARLVILDEPTAALGVTERARVLGLLRALSAQGIAIVLVSHNMEDVIATTARVVLLRRGRKVAEAATIGLTADALAHAVMTGSAPISPSRAGSFHA